MESTAIAGYAGSDKVGTDGKVCYHNPEGDSDYAELGHSEVVRVRIPSDKIGAFAKPYFDLLVEGERSDSQVTELPLPRQNYTTRLSMHAHRSAG